VTGAGGKLRVASMTVEPKNGGNTEIIPVDALIMSAGWTPSVHMFSQSRGKVAWDEKSQRFLPGDLCAGLRLRRRLQRHRRARRDDCGSHRGGRNGREGSAPEGEEIRREDQGRGRGKWAGGMIGAGPGAGAGKVVKAFVDFQNDVTAKDIRLAVQEGMHSIEHVKRFTTNGMATDQGKLSNLHGLAIAAEALNRPIPKVGLTTFRSPYTPTTFGAIVGHARGKLFDPARKTPMHESEVAAGAVFEDVGQWKRAWYYPRAGEDMHAAVNRECRTVREAAGMFDASTLGKIEVSARTRRSS
jgi:sarcosine oxidase subunit alpha